MLSASHEQHSWRPSRKPLPALKTRSTMPTWLSHALSESGARTTAEELLLKARRSCSSVDLELARWRKLGCAVVDCYSGLRLHEERERVMQRMFYVLQRSPVLNGKWTRRGLANVHKPRGLIVQRQASFALLK